MHSQILSAGPDVGNVVFNPSAHVSQREADRESPGHSQATKADIHSSEQLTNPVSRWKERLTSKVVLCFREADMLVFTGTPGLERA